MNTNICLLGTLTYLKINRGNFFFADTCGSSGSSRAPSNFFLWPRWCHNMMFRWCCSARRCLPGSGRCQWKRIAVIVIFFVGFVSGRASFYRRHLSQLLGMSVRLDMWQVPQRVQVRIVPQRVEVRIVSQHTILRALRSNKYRSYGVGTPVLQLIVKLDIFVVREWRSSALIIVFLAKMTYFWFSSTSLKIAKWRCGFLVLKTGTTVGVCQQFTVAGSIIIK